MLKLSRTVLSNETKRRIKDHDVKSKPPNTHSTIAFLTALLKENPISETMEVLYLKKAKDKFVENIRRIVATTNSGLTPSSNQWRGIEPFLRLYHVLLFLRDKFLMRDNTLSRRELDDPNRKTFFDEAEELYNDPNFAPNTIACMTVHPDFAGSFALA